MKSICKLSISSEEIKKLDIVRKKRNKFEHFKVFEDTTVLKSVLASALAVTFNFVEKNLNKSSFNPKEKDLYESIRREASKFQSFVVARLSQFKDILENNITVLCSTCEQKTIIHDPKTKGLKCLFCDHHQSGDIIHCPECKEETLYLDGEKMENSCLNKKCSYSDSPVNIAEYFREEFLDYNSYAAYMDCDDSLKTHCLECYEDTLIPVQDRFICVSCYYQVDKENTGHCESCGEIYTCPEPDLGMCDNCQKNLRDRYERD